MQIKKKRSYKSELRKTRASDTKNQIIDAAQKLFETKGFEKVTIEEIAQSADVSIPTVYALFKSKIGVLRALVDSALSQKKYEELVKQAVSEESPAKYLTKSAAIARQIYDAEKKQLGSLLNSPLLHVELENLKSDQEKRRFERQEASFKKVIKPGSLAPKLSEQKAQDILWALTGRDLYRLLVIEREWTSDEYEVWLTQILEKILLP